jgi:phospholipid/cholesterol/gamma-HCH transport system permease protein
MEFSDFKPELINAADGVQSTINTFSSIRLTSPEKKKTDNIFIRIGGSLFSWFESSKSAFYLVADIYYWSFIGLFDKKGQRKGSVIQQSVLIGVDALGIICLLSLILGLILALQSAAQLRQFGANIFVADLIAISMVTEMGPILTAIILAGRSGSAIASEIATMQVTEEIDALKMMAINPIRYVVVPKFHAITICIPLLVTASTLIGIFGGLIIAVTYLDLSAIVFFNRVFEVLTLKDVLVGLGKSYFFAWVIVIIGSYYGFNVKGGAEGVGKVTTQSVVASIFWIIILDAISSLIFYF